MAILLSRRLWCLRSRCSASEAGVVAVRNPTLVFFEDKYPAEIFASAHGEVHLVVGHKDLEVVVGRVFVARSEVYKECDRARCCAIFTIRILYTHALG